MRYGFYPLRPLYEEAPKRFLLSKENPHVLLLLQDIHHQRRILEPVETKVVGGKQVVLSAIVDDYFIAVSVLRPTARVHLNVEIIPVCQPLAGSCAADKKYGFNIGLGLEQRVFDCTQDDFVRRWVSRPHRMFTV